MYLDTGGNVTIGIGHLLASPSEAQALAFFKGTAKATAAQIKDEYAKVKAQPSGKKVAAYKSDFIVQSGQINALYSKDVQRAYKVAVQRYPQFDDYPIPAQVALLDMAFNLEKKLNQFKTMAAAIKAGDFAKAASECHRKGVQTSRNAMTKKLFMDASKKAAKVGAGATDAGALARQAAGR